MKGKEASRCTEGGVRGWSASCTGGADVQLPRDREGLTCSFLEKEQKPNVVWGPQHGADGGHTDNVCVNLNFAKRLFVYVKLLLLFNQDKPVT